MSSDFANSQRPHSPYQPGGRLLQRWMVRSMFHQRLVNLLLSTCRAHRRLFTSPGGQLRELFQIGVVRGNIPLGISVLSYSGQLNTAVVAAADAIADSV